VTAAKSQAGFTLLEVLASLVLLAFLMAAIFSGLHATTKSIKAGDAVIDRIDQMRAAQEFLRRELAAATAMPWALDPERNPIVFTGDEHQMRFVAPLPGYLEKLGPQLQTLSLVDDGNSMLRLEMTFAMLPPDGGVPRPLDKPEVLLRGIRSGHFSYATRDSTYRLGGWSDRWTDVSGLPVLVRIELDDKHLPPIWPDLIVAVRQGPEAVNVQALARPLLYGRQQ
jgi:general secretion pathway protein J